MKILIALILAFSALFITPANAAVSKHKCHFIDRPNMIWAQKHCSNFPGAHKHHKHRHHKSARWIVR